MIRRGISHASTPIVGSFLPFDYGCGRLLMRIVRIWGKKPSSRRPAEATQSKADATIERVR